MSCSRPLRFLPLYVRDLTGKRSPRSKEAFQKQGNPNGWILGIAATNYFVFIVIPTVAN